MQLQASLFSLLTITTLATAVRTTYDPGYDIPTRPLTNVTVLAVDYAAVGFNIGKIALDDLTGGRAVELGGVDVDWKEVDVAECGF